MFSKSEGSEVINSTTCSFVFNRMDPSKAVKQIQKEVYIRNVIITHALYCIHIAFSFSYFLLVLSVFISIISIFIFCFR